MGDLSNEELHAGISRSALATIQRNGKDDVSLGAHLAAKTEFRLSRPERVYVFDTYDRSLDIVNLDGWHFRIRDLRRTGIKLEQIELHLDRPDLESLGHQILKMLRDTPSPRNLRGKTEK